MCLGAGGAKRRLLRKGIGILIARDADMSGRPLEANVARFATLGAGEESVSVQDPLYEVASRVRVVGVEGEEGCLVIGEDRNIRV